MTGIKFDNGFHRIVEVAGKFNVYIRNFNFEDAWVLVCAGVDEIDAMEAIG